MEEEKARRRSHNNPEPLPISRMDLVSERHRRHMKGAQQKLQERRETAIRRELMGLLEIKRFADVCKRQQKYIEEILEDLPTPNLKNWIASEFVDEWTLQVSPGKECVVKYDAATETYQYFVFKHMGIYTMTSLAGAMKLAEKAASFSDPLL